jgi:carboxyl-terminal processing protease
MNRWLVVAAIFLAAPAAFANPSLRAAPEFNGLPQRERNLAVYDAFWDRLEQNHFDPEFFTRTEIRALREQGRRKAASVDQSGNLYGQVLSEISREFPESHVEARLPQVAAEPAPHYPGNQSQDEMRRLAALLFSGPGFDETTMRRGSKQVRVVSEVMNNSPAEEAGIRPGWRVISYNTHMDTARKTVQFTGEFLPLDATAALAWERGELPVTAPDPAKVVKISYTHRGLAARQPFQSRRVAKGVHYLRFDGFGDDDFMAPVYEALDEAGPDGLIIDLRWNAGGHPRQAQKVAGVLLGEGVTIGYQQAAGGTEAVQSFKPRRQYEGPLALLIGPRSGSASEMLAAAVQDHRRGKLIGRMTNGSLLSAEYFPLPDGGQVMVPTKTYLSPNRRRLAGVGVTPDIRVLPTLEEIRAGRDPTLERAVKIVRAGAVAQRPMPGQRPARRAEFFPPI